MPTLFRPLGGGLIAAALAGMSSLAAGATFQFNIDASPLAGLSGYMAFDLYQGDPAASNEVSITSFATTSTLGVPSTSGDASGSLASMVTLRSTTFFSEFLQPVAFAAGLTTFRVAATQNYLAGTTPDSLAIFLLNDQLTPYATTDPSGADGLITLDLVTPLTPQIYASGVATASVVPEPSRAALLVAGLSWVMGWWAARRAGRLSSDA